MTNEKWQEVKETCFHSNILIVVFFFVNIFFVFFNIQLNLKKVFDRQHGYANKAQFRTELKLP